MELTVQNFCPYIKNNSDNMRTVYICSKNGRICPKVDYTSGKALPNKLFLKNGCPLLNEEQIVEEVKEVKAPKKEKVQKAVEKIAEEIVEEPAIEEVKEDIKEASEEKPIQKPRQNNYKKRQNNNRKK